MEKLAQLEALRAELAADRTLPLRETNLVFGEGSITCNVMFIGEAPGMNEDMQKRQIGRAHV